MIGERIKQARVAKGYSMDVLVEKMGHFVTKQAISKYEKGKSTPNAETLIRIADALGVRTSYFLKETTATLSFVSYRKHGGPTQRELNRIKGLIMDRVENRLWLESLFSYKPLTSQLPKPRAINSFDEVEELAKKLRQRWRLGFNSIDNVAETLEDRGMIVIALETDTKVDGVSAWADARVPVLVTNVDVPGDRQRYNWTHELGHLVAEPAKGLDEESVAHRFAASFLVPSDTVFSELGKKRKRLDLTELHLLKHKYGLSMQAWIRRARDLKIISESYYKTLCIAFRKKGWHKKEPGDPYPTETPNRLKHLASRALAEGVISESKAEEICRGIVSMGITVTEQPLTGGTKAREFAALSIEERRRRLAVAAEDAESEYAANSELITFTALDGVDDAQ